MRDGRTDGRSETNIPPNNFIVRGYNHVRRYFYGSNWPQVNCDGDNGLAPSGNKLLSQPMLTYDLRCHMASQHWKMPLIFCKNLNKKFWIKDDRALDWRSNIFAIVICTTSQFITCHWSMNSMKPKFGIINDTFLHLNTLCCIEVSIVNDFCHLRSRNGLSPVQYQAITQTMLISIQS